MKTFIPIFSFGRVPSNKQWTFLFNNHTWFSFLFCFLFWFSASAQEFITTWTTTSANESITIPTTGGGYNYTVDWGDTNTDTGQTGNATHSYAVAGTYTVKISGDFPRIFFNNNGTISGKIQTIEQWGNIAWTSMERAFQSCSNLTYNATDTPDLSGVTSMSLMFAGATSFNGAIGNWDVSNDSEHVAALFVGATSFNQPLNNWDVSSVTNIQGMFDGASAFHPFFCAS